MRAGRAQHPIHVAPPYGRPDWTLGACYHAAEAAVIKRLCDRVEAQALLAVLAADPTTQSPWRLTSAAGCEHARRLLAAQVVAAQNLATAVWNPGADQDSGTEDVTR